MTDVLLTHSYFLHFDPKELRAMMPYPPLGTLIAAAALRDAGCTVALHDVMFSRSEADLETSIVTHRPRVVLIYDDQFNYLTKMCLSRMRQASYRMAVIARRLGCRVAVFSSDSSDHAEEYLRNGADVVLCGEAEQTLGPLMHRLLDRSNGSMESIDGIAFLKDDLVVRTPRRPVLTDLDVLPMPAWDLLDVHTYRDRWKARHGRFSLNVVTTRGCPFHCNWCAKPIYGQVYHSRSPRNVVDEMVLLSKTLRPDHIWFADDIFGLTPGWIAEFAAELRQRNVLIPFKCLSRADLLLRGDTMQLLRDAGCETVWLGAESGSQRILDAMEKGTTIQQIEQASSGLRKARIRAGFFLQFGYSGETLEEIGMTLDLVRRCLPDEIGISVSYPLPGTKFYERVRAQIGAKQNWSVSEDLDPIVPGSYSATFYRALHAVAHKRHQVWKGQAMIRRWRERPSSFSHRDLRQALKSCYHLLTLPSARRKLGVHRRPVP